MTQHSLSLPTLALASKTLPDALPVDLPDEATCWQAVQRRDRGYNGRFWFSVRTTGVYCLPSCAARPALRRNVDFHASPDAAEAAGFRACKRCKPRDWQADVGLSKPVALACKLFDATDCDTPPSLAEVARKVGLTAGALSKRFIAELGVNPRDWLAARKRQRFRKALREGEAVADALYGAGYGSPSRVYETSDKALGMTPATYAKGGAGAHIDYTTVDSDYGRVLVAATQKGIAAVFLGDNDRTLEKNLKHDFPAADITRNDDASGAARKRRAGASVRPQAVGARCRRRAARHRRHGLPVEGLEGADEDPAGRDQDLRRDRPPHRRPGFGPRRRPRLRHQPGRRRHSLPSRRRRERRADGLSLGRGAQGAAAGRRTTAEGRRRSST